MLVEAQQEKKSWGENHEFLDYYYITFKIMQSKSPILEIQFMFMFSNPHRSNNRQLDEYIEKYRAALKT